MKPSRLLVCGVMVAVILTMAGCVATGSKTGLLGSGKGVEPVAASLTEMPSDAAAVTRCIANRLSGYPCDTRLRLTPTAGKNLQESKVVERGFIIKSASLASLTKDVTDPTTHIANGRINFEDPLGRRTSATFMANYRVDGANIVLQGVEVIPIFDTPPEAVCFILKADDISPDPQKLPRDFASFYRLAGSHAINPASAAGLGNHDYVMVVFFMDRISPTARMILRVSALPSGIEGYDKSSRYLDYNGWRVGLVMGRMTLMDPAAESDLYLKAVSIPGKEAGFLRLSKMVGLYTLNHNLQK